MTCREFAEFLNAYLNGELSPPEVARFERHLRVCDACVNYLDSYKKTILLGRKAFESELAAIPQQVPEELVRAILAARKPR